MTSAMECQTYDLRCVYTDAVSFVTASLSMRLRLSFISHRSRPTLNHAVFSGAFSKQYGFTGRVNGRKRRNRIDLKPRSCKHGLMEGHQMYLLRENTKKEYNTVRIC